MSDSVDLRGLLQKWPYDPDDDARVVRGDDGREILQVRTPVGIEQYETDGRPDGARPHGKETALDHYLDQWKRAKDEGREEAFKLDSRQCGELFTEGTLFYFRYVRLFQLKDWKRTVRDTRRNLRVFDFVHQFAKRPEDREYLEKWRPYIIRVNASAAVMLELESQGYDKALAIANQAIAEVEKLDGLEEETFQYEKERSLVALRELAVQTQK